MIQKHYKYTITSYLMKKRFSAFDIILLIWVYFFGIFLTAQLLNSGFIVIKNNNLQGIIAVLVGMIFCVIFVELVISRRKK